MSADPATVAGIAARLEDLPLELDDDQADALVADLRRAGLVLAAASVAAGQRARSRILSDAAADLLGVHTGRRRSR